jgi:hypothetical protein
VLDSRAKAFLQHPDAEASKETRSFGLRQSTPVPHRADSPKNVSNIRPWLAHDNVLKSNAGTNVITYD